MDFLYYLTGITGTALLGAGIAGVVKPSLFRSKLGTHATRGKLLAGTFGVFMVLGGLLNVTEPASLRQQPQVVQQPVTASGNVTKLKAIATPKVETKDVTTTESIPFTSITQNDGSLTRGTTKIAQTGKPGTKTITYTVTYTDGKETSRAVKSEVVTTQPVTQITTVGTYVAPAQPTQPSCPNGSYVNSDGNTVCDPYSNDSGAPAGATAQCNDGTYSFSQHRSGTCSHHGGVAVWL